MKDIFERCSAKRRRESRAPRGPRRLTTVLAALIAATAAVGGAGCTTFGAKPWEHDLLAEHAMQVTPYPLETAVDEHMYFSKEASSGGRSFAGGGCGCN
jgi:anti-sigma factor RsiW